jgi:hypothetical protein
MRIRIQIRIYLFTLMRIRIQLYTVMRIFIRILLLIKVMGICEHWSTDPPGLNFDPPGVHCERQQPYTAIF